MLASRVQWALVSSVVCAVGLNIWGGLLRFATPPSPPHLLQILPNRVLSELTACMLCMDACSSCQTYDVSAMLVMQGVPIMGCYALAGWVQASLASKGISI